ncbi:MAG: hypothetical protein IJ607_08295 [Bacteroidaceae bacterium]|nr:hypothetical protein [Bacteroidaceae bacterium]
MKKLLLFIWGLVYLNTYAQSNYPGGYNHIIDVESFSDWGRGYLTIVDDHVWHIYKDKYFHNFSHCYFLSYSPVETTRDNFPEIGDVITEVDGNSALNWTTEQFYKAVDNREDVIILKVKRKKRINDKTVEIQEYIIKIKAKKELPDELKVYGNIFAYLKGKSLTSGKEKKFEFESRYDKDFDFFPCRYYDFAIKGDDPLLDKSILEDVYLPYDMVRNETNPDIILTISKNADERISTTYIPPSTRTINTGSKTVTRYNWITEKNEYITTQQNRTIYERGYTQETKTLDLFLEIAALDAKKINDPKINYAPIVWQATAKRHVTNPNFEANEELHAYATWMYFPMDERYMIFESGVAAPIGIEYDVRDPYTIINVRPYSRAENAGLKTGDIVKKIENVDNPKENKWLKKRFKKRGMEGARPYVSDDTSTFKFNIIRDGKKMDLTILPIRRLYFRHTYFSK